MGTSNLKKEEEGLKIGVRNIRVHPEYNDETMEHDFAIVKLKKSISFSNKMNPVCLPDPNEKYEGVQAIVSGWGEIRRRFQQSKSNPILQLVKIRH